MTNKITKEQIDEIVKNSKFDVKKVFGKCTVVSMQLPNGFVLVESSACVDPKNYDRALGEQICKEKLINRVWELEGYRLQNDLNSETDEPKYLNCKICIIATKSPNLTVGKIYEITDGYFIDDSLNRYPLTARLLNVDDLREYFAVHDGLKHRFTDFGVEFVVIKE